MLQDRIDRINKIIAGPSWHGTNPLAANTSEYIVEVWEKALHIFQTPPPEYFVPTFRKAFGSDGTGLTWPLDCEYFASMETAREMATRYGDSASGAPSPNGFVAAEIVEVPFSGSGGLFTASEKEYHMRVKGELVNTGFFAAFYKRNPEADFPGWADKLIRTALGLPVAGE